MCAHATPPKPVKTRHRKPRLASIQTKLETESRSQNTAVVTQNTREAHTVEFHRTAAGARPADPAPCLTAQKGAAPCSSHVRAVYVRVYGYTGCHTPTKSSPYVQLLCLLSLRPVLAWPCLLLEVRSFAPSNAVPVATIQPGLSGPLPSMWMVTSQNGLMSDQPFCVITGSRALCSTCARSKQV